MKIFGVYCGSFEGEYLTEPVYMNLCDAIESAEKKVLKEQKKVEIMHKHGNTEYINWCNISNHVWNGGFPGLEESIRIDVIELVK